MDIDRAGDVDWRFCVGWWKDGGSGFEEEEGPGGACVVEFSDMVAVIERLARSLEEEQNTVGAYA